MKSLYFILLGSLFNGASLLGGEVQISPAQTRVALFFQAHLEINDAIIGEDQIVRGIARVRVTGKNLKVSGLLAVHFPPALKEGESFETRGVWRTDEGDLIDFTCLYVATDAFRGKVYIRAEFQERKLSFASEYALAAK